METRHYVIPVTCLLLAVLSVSCGGGAVSTSAPPSSARTPQPSPSAAPTPTPTVLTARQAASLYLRIVKVSNADLLHVNTFVGHVEPLATFHYWGHRLQRDLHVEAIRLRQSRWPAAMRPVAARLADQDAVLVADLQSMATATNNDEAVAAWDKTATDSSKSAQIAEQLRELLGLPPAT